MHGSEGRRPAPSYGHRPDDWMVGETCWPDFENRIRIKYNFRRGVCEQTAISQSVNVSIVNGSLMCIAHAENLCVLNCRPTTMRWDGRYVQYLRRRAASTSNGTWAQSTSELRAAGRKLTRAQRTSASDTDNDAHELASLRLQGTLARPPKAASAFMYPIARRDADRADCCRREPIASQCGTGR